MDRAPHGGRWSRDPETGALTPGDPAPSPDAAPAALEPEANRPADPEPPAALRPTRKKRN